MLNNVVYFEGNMLSDRSVIKRAEGLKLVRRSGRLLVIEPTQGGSWLLDEAGQAVFAHLSHPSEVREVLAACPEDTKAEALLVNLFNVGIIQVLGKSGTSRPSETQLANIVRLQNEHIEEADCPSCVKRAWLDTVVAPREEGTVCTEVTAQDTPWAAEPMILETIVSNPHDVEHLGEVLERLSAGSTIERLVVKMFPQDSTASALVALLTEGAGKDIKAEVLCYCPADDLASYKAIIGSMLKQQIACLPVGCLESASQLIPWLDQVIAWRYRSAGVYQGALTAGDVLENQAELQALQEAWLEAVAKIACYGEEHHVRLRVHPLEKWLATLGCMRAVERRQYTVKHQAEGTWQWWAEAETPAGCQRCFARSYCAEMKRCEAGGGECWLRKKLFVELLWRFYDCSDIVNYCFMRQRAL